MFLEALYLTPKIGQNVFFAALFLDIQAQRVSTKRQLSEQGLNMRKKFFFMDAQVPKKQPFLIPAQAIDV